MDGRVQAVRCLLIWQEKYWQLSFWIHNLRDTNRGGMQPVLHWHIGLKKSQAWNNPTGLFQAYASRIRWSA